VVNSIRAARVNFGVRRNELMQGTIEAPWTENQVASLNAYQKVSNHHAFTCGERDPDGSEHVLVAMWEGWYCPRCAANGKSYVQSWCHAFMADWSWKINV
jgi:hypothetical protein